MKNQGTYGRRAVLTTLAQWSGAALSIAGLGALETGCGGGNTPAHAAEAAYADYANYANYFDYANYANYSNYINGPYHDYADYADYANYGDYFDHADAYGDAYSDYSNYSNYSDYNDYTDYQDYQDYSDYGDYSDYLDYSNYSDASDDLRVRPPSGSYADYADLYADTGAPQGPGPTGRVPAHRPPFRRGGPSPAKGGRTLALAGPEARLDHAPAPEPGPEPGPERHGLPHAGPAAELKRPARQKPGRRSRTIAGPANRRGPGQKS